MFVILRQLFRTITEELEFPELPTGKRRSEPGYLMILSSSSCQCGPHDTSSSTRATSSGISVQHLSYQVVITCVCEVPQVITT